jgi:tetratricopeptide (TPR) repeat protein
LAPQDARIQVAIFEAAFNLSNIDIATAALTNAVSLDRSLARHWEELGDLFLSSQQAGNALAAYEQCFTAQPEWFHLLKKMGNCYLAMDQLEAAREAFRIYLSKIDSNG